MPKPIILIAEPADYSPRALAIYRSLGQVTLLPNLKGRARAAALREATVLSVRLGHQIDRAWMEQMPRLKVIATPTTGLNHIDAGEAEQRGIAIVSLRGQTSFLKHITSTAEKALGLTLALARRTPWAFDDVKAGRWERNAWRGHQLSGKTLGILGCGRLGTIMARYGRALGMEVIGTDPHVSAAELKRRGIRKVSMDQLFRGADALSIHVLLTDETRNLVTRNHLKMMKPASYLINTARAELIERGALHEALAKRWIAGAATDVLWDERADGSHLPHDPLWAYAKAHENLLISPHIGGATHEAMAITEEFIAERVRERLRGAA